MAASISLIIAGSGPLMRLMRRFPVIVTAGAGLLGYTAGEMLLGDPAVGTWFEQLLPLADPVLPVGPTLFVVAAASWCMLLEAAARRRKQLAAAEEEHPERIELRPH